MNIEHILTTKGRAVSTVGVDERVGNVVSRMRSERIGALIVTDGDGRMVGIVSDRAILWAIADRSVGILEDRVDAIMAREVTTCRCHDPVAGIMATMTERRIRHIPVVDGDGALEGIVSIGDVVKHRLDEIAEEAEALRTYISSAS